ncbi:Abi family protein [Glutamicibacter sp.]|uniref:Abi family protein n=1 Tax=Glutamicibacter sp. TaxID=1931995 RepID=UPI003D6BD0A5
MNPTKPYGTLAHHLQKIEQRGMHLDVDLATQWLLTVGYYRLSGYWYPYRELVQGCRSDTFVAGTSFHDVVALYEFDRKLRTFIHDGVERIEVMLRTQLNEVLGQIDPLAYLEPSHFRPTFDHARWLKTIEGRVERARKRNEAVRHHDLKYGGQLPIWVLSEVLDFADVSRLFEALPASEQWKVSVGMGVHVDVDQLSKNQAHKALKNHPLVRWFEQIAIVRNTSAHHARLWNRSFTPVGTAGLRTIAELSSLPVGQSERLYGALCLMGVLLESASPGTKWRNKIKDLVETSFAPINGRHEGEMGFPEGWRNNPLWSRRPL